MKVKQLLFAGAVLASASAFAQDNNSYFDDTPPNGSRDVLKINVTSLAFKNVSVQYEYLLSKKVSLALGGRAMPSTALPFKGLLIDAVANGDEDTKDIINKSRFSNIAITPEIRFYLGNGWGRGFYAAPYYRFASFSSNTVTINYSEPGGPKRSVQLSGDMTAHTAGVLLGAQWFFGGRIALDWWIAGAHYGIENGEFSGISSKAFTESEQADVKRNIDDLDIPMVKKTTTVSANSVLIKTTGAFGGLRAGLCVGIRL